MSVGEWKEKIGDPHTTSYTKDTKRARKYGKTSTIFNYNMKQQRKIVYTATHCTQYTEYKCTEIWTVNGRLREVLPRRGRERECDGEERESETGKRERETGKRERVRRGRERERRGRERE